MKKLVEKEKLAKREKTIVISRRVYNPSHSSMSEAIAADRRSGRPRGGSMYVTIGRMR